MTISSSIPVTATLGVVLQVSDPGFDLAALVLLFASVVGIINARVFHLPRVIALLAAALLTSTALIVIDRFGIVPSVSLLRLGLGKADFPHMFLEGVLAFLLFAGTLQVRLADLHRERWAILALSTAGVIIATTVFGFGIWITCLAVGTPIPRPWCFVLGSILAPTDPVVVHSLLDKTPMPRRLRAIIDGESLFNDGAGLVVFVITLAIAGGERRVIGHGHALEALMSATLGGAAIGAIFGYLAGRAIRRVPEHILQLTISLALVACCYRLADVIGVSGPIAVVTAGLVLTAMTGPGESSGLAPTVIAFWSLLDELLNTFLFLFVGLQLIGLSLAAVYVLPTLVAIPLSLFSRLVSVIGPIALRSGSVRDKGRSVTVLVWCGLRGGVSIALALTMPPSPFRAELLTICYGVVVFSIVFQGLTLTTLLSRVYGTSRPRLAVA